MARTLVVLAVLALASAGCLQITDEPLPARGFQAIHEESMLPDFTGSDQPTYQMVHIHSHVFPSPQEVRYMNDPDRPRVVCYRLDGLTLMEAFHAESKAAPAAMMDAAPCMPTIDAGTGRLFMNKSRFDELAPRAVAVIGDCNGQIIPIGAHDGGFMVDAPGHRFRVEFLANGTLLVDGQWYASRGVSLKIEYTAPGPRAGGDDDRKVKFVFDHAGRWLQDAVSEPMAWEPPLPPPRPEKGDGPEAWVPRQPGNVQDVLLPLLDAYALENPRVTEFRATAAHGALTDLRVTVQGGERVRWFVAGGTADKMRMIGSVATHPESASGIDANQFQKAFASVSWNPYLQQTGSDSLTFRWANEVSYRSTAPIAWAETWLPSTQACKGACAYVWAPGPAGGAPTWRELSDPVSGEKENPFTLQIVELNGARAVSNHTYYRP